MTVLVPFAQAKIHLRVDDDDSDADIIFKLEQASAIVLDYLKITETEWNEYTCPHLVQAAILLVLGELYDGTRKSDSEPLSATVRNLLHRYRDPALA